MNAKQEIRNHAHMFAWACHTDDRRQQDTFIHGQHMIAVDYRRDGAVNDGSHYVFNKVDNPVLEETAGSRDKKSSVVSWLVRLGH